MQKSSTSITFLFAFVCAAALAAASATAADAPNARAETAPAPGAAAAPAPAGKPSEPQPPVRISADAAEYFNKDGLVIFTGNVVVVQSDSTLSADRMEIFFDKAAPAEVKPSIGIASPAGAQKIRQIVALNKVSFRQVDPESGKERYATGDKGVYDVEQRFVTMSGNPRLWEGKNVIVGEEMIFRLDEKKVIVKGKVNLTVFPDEMKEEKKP